MQPLCIPTKMVGLVLREVTIDDVLSFFRLIDASRDHLCRWHDETAKDNTDPRAAHETFQRELKDTRLLRMGIWHEDNLVGSIYRMKLQVPYRREIGYWLGKECTGFGFATVSLQGLVSHIFNVEEQLCIVANAHEGNTRSQAVLERAGFYCNSRTKERLYYRLQRHQHSET
jgi:RimJ/RimL family protein N-acetyltransferase